MELRQIEYFQETCRRGTVSAAAAVLNVSQPSVTTGIRKLEEELGVPLFDRTNRRLAVTAIGREFLKDAEAILALVEDARARTRDYQSEPRGVVKLGITPMMCVTLLPPIVAGYQRAYPDVELRIVEEGSLSIAAHLEKGELDLGILIAQDLPQHLESVVIRKGEVLVCLPSGHPFADRDRVSMADLRDQPFILFREDTYSRQLIVRECARFGFEPKVVFVSSQIGTVAGLVREGMGIAFFFEDIARTLDSLVFKPLASPLELEAGVVWNTERYLSSASQRLIDALQQNRVPGIDQSA